MKRLKITADLHAGLLAGVLATLLTGCAGLQTTPDAETPPSVPPPVVSQAPSPAPKTTPAEEPPPPKHSRPTVPAPGTVLAKDAEFVVLFAGPGDTAKSLASRFLGDERLSWRIEEFNNIGEVVPGLELVIPLVDQNSVGVFAEGYQTVPILCYHRFGDKKAKMVVTPKAFADQMEYLSKNGYHVIHFDEFAAFLAGRRSLPRKSVLVTIDDGYKSSYQVAYPILKRYGFPATIFVYTDFIGAGDGLTWGQLEEMASSRIIDLQPHSKTHADLANKLAQETTQAYAKRIKEEVVFPAKLLGERLHLPMTTFAYPYGDANDLVVTQTREAGYGLAATVLSGGNPFFAHPFLLRRTMIFGEDELEAFKAKLDLFRPLGPQ